MSVDSQPAPAPVVAGETCSGNRNLPAYLASLLEPGPTLIVGSCPLAVEVAAQRRRAGRRNGEASPETFILDSDARRIAHLARVAREHGLAVDFLCRDIEREPIGLPPRGVANVVCLDALERVRDDVGVLEKMHRVIAPEGRLVVRVRARAWARCPNAGDRGAPRRVYDAESLRDSLEEAAFRPISLRHWNFLGVPGTFLNERVLRRNGGSDPASTHWWDRGIDLWFKTIENRVGFPVGVSLVAVATPFFEKASVASPAPGRGFTQRVGREAYEPMGSWR